MQDTSDILTPKQVMENRRLYEKAQEALFKKTNDLSVTEWSEIVTKFIVRDGLVSLMAKNPSLIRNFMDIWELNVESMKFTSDANKAALLTFMSAVLLLEGRVDKAKEAALKSIELGPDLNSANLARLITKASSTSNPQRTFKESALQANADQIIYSSQILGSSPVQLLKNLVTRYPEMMSTASKVLVAIDPGTRVVSAVATLPADRSDDAMDISAWDNASDMVKSISDGLVFLHVGDRDTYNENEAERVVDVFANTTHTPAPAMFPMQGRILDVLWATPVVQEEKDGSNTNNIRWGSMLCTEASCCDPQGSLLN